MVSKTNRSKIRTPRGRTRRSNVADSRDQHASEISPVRIASDRRYYRANPQLLSFISIRHQTEIVYHFSSTLDGHLVVQCDSDECESGAWAGSKPTAGGGDVLFARVEVYSVRTVKRDSISTAREDLVIDNPSDASDIPPTQASVRSGGCRQSSRREDAGGPGRNSRPKASRVGDKRLADFVRYGAKSSPTNDYTLFLHLVDGAGRLVG